MAMAKPAAASHSPDLPHRRRRSHDTSLQRNPLGDLPGRLEAAWPRDGSASRGTRDGRRRAQTDGSGMPPIGAFMPANAPSYSTRDVASSRLAAGHPLNDEF